MGQYYKPIFLNEKEKPVNYFNSHDFGSGLKLMEHSWMKNDFVGFVEGQLILEPRKLVWAGDYADAEAFETLTKDEIKKLTKEDFELKDLKEIGVTLYSLSYVSGTKATHNEDFENYEAKYKHKFNSAVPSRYKYLINYDKQEFVDKSKVPLDNDGWQIHPLPLLTCEGNNRGGGDFRGNEKNLVGVWSRDKIGLVSKKSDIPEGFKELLFDLSE